jgi:CubicO group peptidase (beta-lactamase class C family)
VRCIEGTEGHARIVNDDELQALLDSAALKLGVVGAQVAIFEDNRERTVVTGYRDLERNLPVTTDTLFQIGSTTKLLNAALVLSLVEAGTLTLDAPVRRYLPEFRLADPMAQESVSLRHLLSMTSGLDNGTYDDYGRGDDALGRYVEALARVPQIFAPGTAFGYSNASTNVAGHVASHVSRQSWESLLTERILSPLCLRDFVLLPEDILPHLFALGYQLDAHGGSPVRAPVSFKRSLGPAGSMTYCSASNLVRFARMCLDGGKSADGLQVLSPNTVAAFQEPQVKLYTRLFADEWCLGPYRKTWDHHPLYGHSGTNYSGSSVVLWCPSRRVAIAVVSNVASQGYPLADELFDTVFPKLFSIEKPKAPEIENLQRVEVDLRPYCGRFEAVGMQYEFSIQGEKLALKAQMGADETSCVELVSLGEGRFLPCDLSISGNRNWDIAFWGRDPDGKASHLLQGVFPLRRTS